MACCVRAEKDLYICPSYRTESQSWQREAILEITLRLIIYR